MMRPTTGVLRTQADTTNKASDTLPVYDLSSNVLKAPEVMPDGTVQKLGSHPVTLPIRDDLLARPQGMRTH
jgi:hypothetical protein